MDDRKSEGALETVKNTGMCSNGDWFFGRPTIEDLRQDLRAVLKKCRPDWDITRRERKAAWERGEGDRFYPYGKTYRQVFRGPAIPQRRLLTDSTA
jgi:hypothetical protein